MVDPSGGVRPRDPAAHQVYSSASPRRAPLDHPVRLPVVLCRAEHPQTETVRSGLCLGANGVGEPRAGETACTGR